jgi:hypothetical protein
MNVIPVIECLTSNEHTPLTNVKNALEMLSDLFVLGYHSEVLGSELEYIINELSIMAAHGIVSQNLDDCISRLEIISNDYVIEFDEE